MINANDVCSGTGTALSFAFPGQKTKGLFQVSCFSADFLDCEKAGKNYMYIGVGRFRILGAKV